MRKNAKFIASFKPGSRFIVKSENTDYSVSDLFVKSYVRTTSQMRKLVDGNLVPFYGRPLNIPDDKLVETFHKIELIIKESGVRMEEMATTIRNYLGGEVTFFREENNRSIPIPSNKLLQAFKAVKGGYSKAFINQILYK